MKETTAAWLSPMLDEAKRQSVDLAELMRQASMPAREVDWEDAGKPDPARLIPDTLGLRVNAIDWIRLGQLLRVKLDWPDYPEWPPVGR